VSITAPFVLPLQSDDLFFPGKCDEEERKVFAKEENKEKERRTTHNTKPKELSEKEAPRRDTL